MESTFSTRHFPSWMAGLVIATLAVSITSAGDLTFTTIGKGIYYEQMSGPAPVQKSGAYLFHAEARIPPNPFGVVYLAGPLRQFGREFIPGEGGYYSAYRRFADQERLDLRYPSGTYVFDVNTLQGGPFVTNIMQPGSFPNAPAIANLAAAQSVDATKPFELTWNPFVGGTTADFIHCEVQAVDSNVFNTPFLGVPGALDGTATSVVIPAGTLSPGRAYVGRLVFASVQALTTNEPSGAVAATLYFSQTDFWLKTSGAGDNTPPTVTWTSPTNGATGVPANTSVAVHFTKPMRTDNYYVQYNRGGIVSVNYSPEGLEVVLTWQNPFTGALTVLLNPFDGRPPIFGDRDGNPLAPDTVAASFTNGSSLLVPRPGLLSAPLAQSDGTFKIDLQGEPHYPYSLESSTDLTNWSSVATNMVFCHEGSFIVTNNAPGGTPVVYRAVAR